MDGIPSTIPFQINQMDTTNKRDQRNPSKVKMAYTPDSIWRNRGTFVKGRDEIEAFLTDKWNREHDYKLRKELFAFDNDKASLTCPFLCSPYLVLTSDSDRRAVLV